MILMNVYNVVLYMLYNIHLSTCSIRIDWRYHRLDSAESKATVLQKLCDRVRFKPELAALMHKNIYKQKVDSILAEEKKISDERDEELGRLRKLMCIPEVPYDDF